MTIERHYLADAAALDELADLLCRLLLEVHDEPATGEESSTAPAVRSSCFSVEAE